MEFQGYHMPDELHYEQNHFWIKQEGDLLVMGMDDFAQKMAGEIVSRFPGKDEQQNRCVWQKGKAVYYTAILSLLLIDEYPSWFTIPIFSDN